MGAFVGRVLGGLVGDRRATRCEGDGRRCVDGNGRRASGPASEAGRHDERRSHRWRRGRVRPRLSPCHWVVLPLRLSERRGRVLHEHRPRWRPSHGRMLRRPMPRRRGRAMKEILEELRAIRQALEGLRADARHHFEAGVNTLCLEIRAATSMDGGASRDVVCPNCGAVGRAPTG